MTGVCETVAWPAAPGAAPETARGARRGAFTRPLRWRDPLAIGVAGLGFAPGDVVGMPELEPRSHADEGDAAVARDAGMGQQRFGNDHAAFAVGLHRPRVGEQHGGERVVCLAERIELVQFGDQRLCLISVSASTQLAFSDGRNTSGMLTCPSDSGTGFTAPARRAARNEAGMETRPFASKFCT